MVYRHISLDVNQRPLQLINLGLGLGDVAALLDTRPKLSNDGSMITTSIAP